MTKFIKTWFPLIPFLKLIQAQGSGEYFSGTGEEEENYKITQFESQNYNDLNKVEPEIRDAFVNTQIDHNLDGFTNFKTEDPFYEYVFQPNFEISQRKAKEPKIKKKKVKNPETVAVLGTQITQKTDLKPISHTIKHLFSAFSKPL